MTPRDPQTSADPISTLLDSWAAMVRLSCGIWASCMTMRAPQETPGPAGPRGDQPPAGAHLTGDEGEFEALGDRTRRLLDRYIPDDFSPGVMPGLVTDDDLEPAVERFRGLAIQPGAEPPPAAGEGGGMGRRERRLP